VLDIQTESLVIARKIFMEGGIHVSSQVTRKIDEQEFYGRVKQRTWSLT